MLKSSFKTESFYKDLNTNQKKAVQTFHGPVLVLAGAGSGKTRVLVYRIVALIIEGHCSLDNILAVTFTNKAAKEMKERVYQLLKICGYPFTHTYWINTFHSVCAQILRQNISLLPGRSTVTIYDQSDQISLIKKILKDLNIDPGQKDPKSIRSKINLCKRKALSPFELHVIPHLSYDKQFQTIYQKYELALKQASAFDFEGLLLETYRLTLKQNNFLTLLQNQFQYICIDEYQDTNTIQYLLIKQISKKTNNICVVGDEDQSIYSWRGADMNNIMSFEKDFKNCKTFFLEENYRSTKNIIQGANQLISNNKNRKGKVLVSHQEEGQKIYLIETFNEYEEASFVAKYIQSHCLYERTWSDVAILYRTNAQSRPIEDHLRILKIPYKIVGGVRFYERQEIKDALSYLRLVLNSKDNLAFLRSINTPRRGIGKVSLEKLQQQSLKSEKSLYECLKDQVQSRLFRGKVLINMCKFVSCIEDIKNQLGHVSLYNLYTLLLNKSGYIESLESKQSIEETSRINNLQELGNVIEQKEKQLDGSFLNLETFLTEMSLLTQEDKTKDGQDYVTLMTLHSSKGLEFKTVFMVGMEEGLFPSFQSLEDGNLEEERRLAYVGITRAQQKLIFSFAKKRKFWGKDQFNPPSSFLSEISQDLIHHEFPNSVS